VIYISGFGPACRLAGGGKGHIHPGPGARGHPYGQEGHVRGTDAGWKSEHAQRGLWRRIQGDIRQEAKAHPQEPGDTGGWSAGGQGAGDGGEEVGQPIYFLILFVVD